MVTHTGQEVFQYGLANNIHPFLRVVVSDENSLCSQTFEIFPLALFPMPNLEFFDISG
jgi:hypothetical protein